MLIPLEVDVPEERWPVVNWFIIGACVVIFGFEMLCFAADDFSLFEPFVLDGFGLTGMFGHMWLHGGIMHLIGNMVFLWIFGNAVCAKLGNIRFLLFYLAVGLISGSAHVIFGGERAIGASGAINGVVGIFLVFFPANAITCGFIWWLIPPIYTTFTLSSYWMILFWLTFDIWGAFSGIESGTAYWAHVGGFAGGFGLGVLMLKMGWVEMERYEESLLSMLGMDRKMVAVKAKDAGLEAKKVEDKNSAYQEAREARLKRERERWKREAAEAARAKAERAAEQVQRAKAGGGVIKFACKCGRVIRVKGELAGRKGRCPECGGTVIVPGGRQAAR
ncbi:rhomboid family intramembrane serine protease [Anaerohalosphaera lusitana]|nr:rhomboid family intramembrane serine protease [Anaerohalosphaera lusitana]